MKVSSRIDIVHLPRPNLSNRAPLYLKENGGPNNTSMVRFSPSIGIACIAAGASAFSPQASRSPHTSTQLHHHHQASSSNNSLQDHLGAAATAVLSFTLLTTPVVTLNPSPAHATDGGASTAANSKITTGGASTLQSGRVSIQLILTVVFVQKIRE